MTAIYECDWCGERFENRAAVASADITISDVAEKCHMCPSCLPDWIVDRVDVPEKNKTVVADGGVPVATPTYDTPLSYQMRCGACEAIIGQSARYCPRCGTKVDDGDDGDQEKLLTGGER